MKFEQVLHIYWTKGFFFNGQLYPFDSSLNDLMVNLGGFGRFAKLQIVKRFEFSLTYLHENPSFIDFPKRFWQVLNLFFAQLTSINNDYFLMLKYNLVRLYLIKSFRGRAQALGKPSRGQRTWSNAWTAYKYNTTIRSFVSLTYQTLQKGKREEKVNFKLLKKKMKKVKHKVKIKKAKPNAWF